MKTLRKLFSVLVLTLTMLVSMPVVSNRVVNATPDELDIETTETTVEEYTEGSWVYKTKIIKVTFISNYFTVGTEDFTVKAKWNTVSDCGQIYEVTRVLWANGNAGYSWDELAEDLTPINSCISGSDSVWVYDKFITPAPYADFTVYLKGRIVGTDHESGIITTKTISPI